MLTIAFQTRFPELTEGQKTLYALTIVMCAVAMAFLVGPVAVHRFAFGRQLKPAIVKVAHYMTLVGLMAMLLAGWIAQVITIGIAALLVTCWVTIPVVMLIFQKRLSDEIPSSTQ